MNELVFIENEQVVTDSLTIAEMFDKRHDHVLRDIKNQIELAGEEFSSPNFGESTYEARGKEYPKFNLTEEAFTLVVFSYNTKEAVQTKIKFIKEFKRMREFIESKQHDAQDPITLALEAALETRKDVKVIQKAFIEVKADVDELKDNLVVSSSQAKAINKKVREKVYNSLGGKDAPAFTPLKSKVFSACWREFKDLFDINEFRDLPRIKFEVGMQFLCDWEPNATLKFEIKQLNGQGSLF